MLTFLVDISIGPTTGAAVFTGQIVKGLPPGVPAPLVTTVVSFCVGLWSMIFGVLNLGFIFDFVSIPMALGFTMGISFVAMTQQLPPILGLDVTGGIMDLMPKIIQNIGQAKPITFGIGATSILILAILQFIGKKWGRRSPFLYMLSSTRYLFVLGTYAMISKFVNQNLEIPLWSILGPIKTTIPSPTMPIKPLLDSLILPCIALFISNALEHVALAKAFANENNYNIDQSQEVFSLGVINLVNSMFGGLTVGGGDMARSSVLAGSGSKSPLNGVFSSITVLVSMYFLSDVFLWLPQATVAAVTLVSIADQMPPQVMIGVFWKISFVDFIHFIIAFNFSMLQGGQVGIGLSIAFMVGYTLFRAMFSRPRATGRDDLETQYSNDPPAWWAKDEDIPAGTQVVTLETDVMWLNASRIRRHIVDTVYTFHTGVASSMHPLARPWSTRRDKHIASLRQKAFISEADDFLPPFRVLVLDMTATSFIDTTGIQALQRMRTDLLDYGGLEIEFRFVGMCKAVRRRFQRAGWDLMSPQEETELRVVSNVVMNDDGEITAKLVDNAEGKKDLVFGHLPHAIQFVGGLDALLSEEIRMDIPQKF